MKGYQKNFSVHNLVLPNNIFYAPLAGQTDYPMRKMIAQFRPGIFFTEMVRGKALVDHFEKIQKNLDYDVSMHPIGAQIYENDIQIAREAAQILEQKGFDLIDFNCACPASNIIKQKCGAYFLQFPQLFAQMIRSIVQSVNIPVSVKLRIGWDRAALNAPLLTQIAEDAGAGAVIVHGRTAMQGYRGRSDLDQIALCKKNTHRIPLIGNGDIFTPQDAQNMWEKTGCDGILIGRAMMGNVGIAQEIADFYFFNHYQELSFSARIDLMHKHFTYIRDYYAPKKALLEVKKVAFWYLKGHQDMKNMRKKIRQASSLSEIFSFCEELWKNK